MGHITYIIFLVLVQFHLRCMQCLISDFYVPGKLIAGPDFSEIYPAEIFSANKAWSLFRQASSTEMNIEALTEVTPAQTTFQCAGTKFIQCSGCNKYAICTGAGDPITEINCASDRPYCNTRVEGDFCSGPPVNNSFCTTSSSFVCTSTGYFPNLENCRKYHICARDTTNREVLVASDYICPQGYYFSVEIKACRRQFLARECTRRELRCTNATMEPTKYDPSSQYYYFCKPSIATPIVFRCPDNSQYSSADYECKYRCRRQANFAHSDNERRYFVCYMESRRLTSRIEECADGFIFSKTQSVCVDKSLL